MDFKHVKENEEKSVLEKKEKVDQDFWRQKYHLQGIVGLINDPNGFSQFKGKYHLFYQWNPLKTDHTAKYWAHSVSDDLLHWERKSTALRPDTWYSKNGVYSGSGIVIDEKLYLFYTGNVKDEKGNRSSYQCFAVSEDGENFERLEPSIVNQPDGYTRHIRDPKIWEKDGKYYISGLPWFSAIESSQAGHFSEDGQLQLTANDHFSDGQRKKVEKFLKVFFTNYTTNQDNLNLIAKDVDIIANTTFKTIDYTYLKKDGKNIIAYVQATFEVGGTTHSENFTFTLSEKEKTYYVTKLEHTIPLNYANDKE